MDWNKCALCQTGKDNLVDPSYNKDTEKCGYSILARNIEAFEEEDLPLPSIISVAICDLKGECGIAATLQRMHAKWHKRCALEVAPSKLLRAKNARDRNKNREKPEFESGAPAKKTRASLSTSSPELGSLVCFFCDLPGVLKDEESSVIEAERWNKDAKDQRLHRVTSINRDANVREAARQMGDTKVLAKLSEGDMIAREAFYHGKCMSKFTNRYRKFLNQKNSSDEKLVQKNLESIALTQVMMFVEETL